jgi:zinc protease
LFNTALSGSKELIKKIMETLLNRSVQPATKEIEKIVVAQPRKFNLDNGIPVYAITAGFQDLIKIEFLFPNKTFDVNNPLLNSTANRMLSDGTTKYTAQQLADKIDYYGAFLETDENADFTSVMLYTLNKYFEQTIPFINEMLRDAIFPQTELDLYIRNNRQRLTIENEKVASLARRKFNQLIFGQNHAYGYFVETTDYDKLNRDKISAHYKDKYVPSNCTIIISGLVKDSAIDILNKNFGKWGGQAQSKNGIHRPFESSNEKKSLVSKDDAVQSAIRIGKPFFNRRHEDYPAMAVVNTILGGYFGSRLMSNIREDKGYTYGIGSAIVSMKQNGYFFISTEVGADVTKPAIEETYKEIEFLKSEPVDDEELEMARNYMLGTFLKGMDGAFQLAERFKSVYLYDLDYDYYDRYIAKLRSITADEIQALSKKHFDLSTFYELVVGKLS